MLVSAERGELLEDVGAAALDIAVVQAMDERVTVLMDDPHLLVGAAVLLLLVAAATASLHHHTVVVKNYLMPMEMVRGIVAEAGAEVQCLVFGP